MIEKRVKHKDRREIGTNKLLPSIGCQIIISHYFLFFKNINSSRLNIIIKFIQKGGARNLMCVWWEEV